MNTLAIVETQQIKGSKANLRLRIPTDLEYLRGHFTGQPVLPGVVQLKWALHYAEQSFGCKFHFAGAEVIKFQHPLLPNTRVNLDLDWDQQRKKLRFSYYDTQQNYASARIKLR
ncbi:ApeI family dehydratase [Agarivorans sp. QJM3NY_33]|uniref:ApeI family dehydratase n=1 Tax=Agarivorans sp. QJM3NY_33 TaxID=3421432 RepID=UPI003D7E0214